MEKEYYLNYLVEEMHTTVLATVDEEGKPVTAVIDMMYTDGDDLYFLTAKGKGLYKRLKADGHIALSSWKGEKSLNSKAISIRGVAVEMGEEPLSLLFEKNQYMYEIYKTKESRGALTVFKIEVREGEFFDLSANPIFREVFGKGKHMGYHVTEKCIGCERCIQYCPQRIIKMKKGKAYIQEQHCLNCGSCLSICPANAIERVV